MSQRYYFILASFHRRAIVFLIVTLILTIDICAQTISVKGLVSSSSGGVRFAAVTFIEKNDTTKWVTVHTDTSGRYSIGLITSVMPSVVQPTDFELGQNYPNPFTSSTAISYQLNEPSDIRVTIYDILGRSVREFTRSDQATGAHGLSWDGRNNSGNLVSPGIYFYKLQTKHGAQVRKMLFGYGSSETATLPPGIIAPRVPNMSLASDKSFIESRYNVSIANTDSTFPLITPQRFIDLTVQNNVTLDFAVSSAISYTDQTRALIYPENLQQNIRGFGGANILQWRPDMTPAQVQKAFGSGPGELGFSILRLRVPYDLTTGALSMQLPTAKLAQSLGAIVIASPWTPPAWMKTNNTIVGGRLNDTSYASYALHLKKFADYMTGNGAPLYAISVQNEPDVKVSYESCDWTPAEMNRFVREFAPAIGTRIIAAESFNFNRIMTDPILNEPAAAANLSIVGGHIYGGGLGAYPLATSIGKEIWMTEHLELDTTWSGVLGTGKEISDCMKAGWNAYIWWYTVRYYGPISETGDLTKRGYVMSQFARFVRPGFTRVQVSDYSPRTLVEVTAYKNGPKIIIVAVNRNSTAREHPFTIWNGTAGTFTPYITSVSKNCVQQNDIPFKNGTFTYTLEPLSVTTFVLKF